MAEGLELSPRKERIAELYFVSESVQFREEGFAFSVHQDNPDLPKSPNKLHYPQPGEPGSEYLPELFGLIGTEFFDICEVQDPPIQPKRIGAVPEGALPLADALARHYTSYPKNVLTFPKTKLDGITIFGKPEGEYEQGDEMLQVDDHTSAGRNAKVFRHAAKRAGLVVPNLVSVIDREQGGVANLASDGARLLSILKIGDLLDFGVLAGHISQEQADKAKAYNAANQFEIGYHVLPIDNTVNLLEKMRNDPLAVASCEYHEDFLADVIFAAPEGVWHNRNARIVAYCGQHLIKGEGAEGCIPLFGQTGDYWIKRNGYKPVFPHRDNLDDYEAVVTEIFTENVA